MKRKALATMMAAAMVLSMVGCGGAKTDSTASTTTTEKTEAAATEAADSAASADATVENKDKPLCWFNRQPSSSATGELDKEALNFNGNTYYVGFDANQGAELQGQMVLDYIKENADTIDRNGDGVIGYVLAIGDIGHNDSIARTRGVRSTLGTGVEADGTVDSTPAGTNVDGKAKVVKEKTGQPILTSQAGSPDLVMEMLQSCGESLFNEDGSVNIKDNKALKPILEIYQQMVADGTLVEVTDWDQYIASINNGTTAGVINGCWIMASIVANDDQSGKWAITNMPKLDDVDGATNYSNNGGSSWAISSNCQKQDLAIDFMKSTFAGSTDLYDDIISKGALATWAPAGDTDAYAQPVEFFSNEAVYAKIVDFATKTPSNITGPFYYDARDAVGVALSNIIQSGADMDDEIATAQDTVEFNMGG